MTPVFHQIRATGIENAPNYGSTAKVRLPDLSEYRFATGKVARTMGK